MRHKHYHAVEIDLTILHQASILFPFWSYAFQTTTYLINRMPSSSLLFDTLFGKLFHHHPNYKSLRVFGCLCYPWLRPYNTHKLETHSHPYVFLGYSIQHHACYCFDLKLIKFLCQGMMFLLKMFFLSSTYGLLLSVLHLTPSLTYLLLSLVLVLILLHLFLLLIKQTLQQVLNLFPFRHLIRFLPYYTL